MLDIIGDVHGHAGELTELLDRLGYQRGSTGTYGHPSRRAVFVGDLIDRGPRIADVLQIVRDMVHAGAAQLVMGNHEFNAISFHTPHPRRPGSYAREHTAKNVKQHSETLRQLSAAELRDSVEWFRTIAMWLEVDGIRAVHATWDQHQIDVLSKSREIHGGINVEFVDRANEVGTQEFAAIDDVLKGKEIKLPNGMGYIDKDGQHRTKMRTRWFESPGGHTFASFALTPDPGLPELPLPAGLDNEPYDAAEPPVFVGHYWLSAERPARLAPNVACVDYSVAKGGMLVAYRWDGESTLSNDKFISVPAATSCQAMVRRDHATVRRRTPPAVDDA